MRLSFECFEKNRIATNLIVIFLTSVTLLGFNCGPVDQILMPGTPDAIKIGFLLDADFPASLYHGAELAQAQINAEGGVLGFPIDLVVKHITGNAEQIAISAEELITQEGVVAIIGPGFTARALHATPIAQQHQIPMVTTTATNPAATSAGDFVFMASFTDNFQGSVMASFARQELRAQTAATLTQTGGLYSEGLAQIFEDDFIALGGEIVSREFYNAGDTDFTEQLTRIAEIIPDVVFIPGFAPEVPLAIKQARTIPQRNANGITATFLGGDGWDDPRVTDLGGDAVEDSFHSNVFTPEVQDPIAQKFVEAYILRFGAAPDSLGAMGYDALRLVATAIRRAGSIQNTAIRDQLAATRGYKGATTLLHYDENRHPTKSAVIMKIEDGQVRLHKLVEP